MESPIRWRVFYQACEDLNFSRTGEQLFMSQPAVTKHIKELEQALSCRLFDRSGNKLQLTEKGKLVRQYCQKILGIYDELNYVVSDDLNKSGQLLIGASTTIGQYILPKILHGFQQKYNEVKINLFNGNSSAIEQDLLSGKIHIGLIEGKINNAKLRFDPFMRDEIVPVAHKNSTYYKRDSLSLDELRTIPIVLREWGSGTLDIIRKVFQQYQIKLNECNILLQIGSTEGLKNYLRNADAIGFLSIHAIQNELTNMEFKIIDIEDFEITRNLHFITLQGEQSKLCQLFQKFVLKQSRP